MSQGQSETRAEERCEWGSRVDGGCGVGRAGAAPCRALGRMPGLPGQVKKRLWFGHDPQSPDVLP